MNYGPHNFRKTCPCCRFKMKNHEEHQFMCKRCKVRWTDGQLEYFGRSWDTEVGLEMPGNWYPVPEGLLLPVRERAV